MPRTPLYSVEPSTPSSSQSPNPQRTPSESTADHDALDPFWTDQAAPADLLGEDPLAENLDERMTFKRKPKRSFFSNPARFFSAFANTEASSSQHDEPEYPPSSPIEDTRLHGLASPPRRTGNDHSAGPYHAKDGVALDWYAEGPGRRVAYEDLTAIDWIFEYTKERQRVRVLNSGASGLLGYVRRFLDASQVWVILILTGITVGAVAAGIDVTTNWLGDLKTGFCRGGPDGGAFYLNRNACCLGYDEGSKCLGWSTWGEALGVHSAGGKWFLEYFFFIMFSVWHLSPLFLLSCV
jgi:chloride channel 3/4/5